MNTLFTKLERSKTFWFLLITCAAFFLLRIPSLFEPYWYGDEGVYQVLGLGIDHGRLLYQGIWDNKPPLLYMLYALLHSDQFLVRFASLLFGIGAIVAFFYLSRELFEEKEKLQVSIFTTALFAFLFGIPLIEGNIANAENFMLFPIIAAGYLVYKKNAEREKVSYYASYFFPGFLLGLAFLFKIVGVFDFTAFGSFIFIVHFGLKKIRQIIEILIPYVIGFALPILITCLFFISKGIFSDFLHAAFTQNVGYVGYGNSFIIPQGFLILKLLILGLFLLFLFARRSKISTPILFGLIWIAFSLFDSFFSGRPYTHYVLMTIPSLCILTGLLLYDKKLRVFLSILLILILIILAKNFTYYGKTFLYYQNYVSFVLNEKSLHDYQSFFDSNTPRDYELADFFRIHLHPSDNVFIWGNNAQVYALINKLPPGRYTVAYHMTASPLTIKETAEALNKVKPNFIAVDQHIVYPFSLALYRERMKIGAFTIYERAF